GGGPWGGAPPPPPGRAPPPAEERDQDARDRPDECRPENGGHAVARDEPLRGALLLLRELALVLLLALAPLMFGLRELAQPAVRLGDRAGAGGDLVLEAAGQL